MDLVAESSFDFVFGLADFVFNALATLAESFQKFDEGLSSIPFDQDGRVALLTAPGIHNHCPILRDGPTGVLVALEGIQRELPKSFIQVRWSAQFRAFSRVLWRFGRHLDVLHVG
jgi:hypothetical protein